MSKDEATRRFLADTFLGWNLKTDLDGQWFVYLGRPICILQEEWSQLSNGVWRKQSVIKNPDYEYNQDNLRYYGYTLVETTKVDGAWLTYEQLAVFFKRVGIKSGRIHFIKSFDKNLDEFRICRVLHINIGSKLLYKSD